MDKITIRVNEESGEAHLTKRQIATLKELIDDNALLAADILNDAICDLLDLYEAAHRACFPGVLEEGSRLEIIEISAEVLAEREKEFEKALDANVKRLQAARPTRH